MRAMEELRRTNSLMERKIDDYIAPRQAGGLQVTIVLA